MSAAIQGSAQWLADRLGKVGASRVSDVVARTKSGWGASRANLMAELIAERLTGSAAERFTNASMEWGTLTEADARLAYEFHTGAPVVEVGFIEHPTIPMTGASPDGLVGDHGLVEIKCPNTATHLDTLLGAAIPEKYVTQMMWQLACTNREWCDWVSFDPRLPEHLRIVIRRVPRNAVVIASLEKEVAAFLDEIDARIESLSHIGQPLAVALQQSIIAAG